jgi:hypothetical protein
MKHLRPMLAVAIVMLAMAIPSISAAQYHEERLDQFLNQRPELKEQLERNPNLIYNKEWRERHPDLQAFLQNHPNIWGKLPDHDRWGAYGPDHTWHEADWWHDHDRGWMWTHHPEWAENHADWRDEGDFDEHHEWHDRDWWHDHHPDWVDQHHPDWYKHPYEHPIAAEEHKHAVEQGHHHDHDHQ